MNNSNAFRDFITLCDLAPGVHPPAIAQKAVLALRMLELGKAEFALAQAQDSPDAPLLAFVRALILHRDGRLGEAEAAYAEALQAEFAVSECHFNLGLCCMERGISAKTREDGDRIPLEAAVRHFAAASGHPLAAHLKGRALAVLGRPLEAVAAYETCLTGTDGDAGVWRAIGEAWEQHGDRKAAAKAYARSAELAPGDIPVRALLLDVLRRDGEADALRRVAAEIAARAPFGPIRAEALAILGRWDDAAREVAALKEGVRPEFWAAAALARAWNGETEAAAEALIACLRAEFQGDEERAGFARLGLNGALLDAALAAAGRWRGDRGALAAIAALRLDPLNEAAYAALEDRLEEVARPSTAIPSQGGEERSPLVPPKVIVHTPVWGERYVGFFVDHALPTFLSPGNLPVLAAATAIEYEIVTTPEDRRRIETSPAFAQLADIAAVRFTTLDRQPGERVYDTIDRAARACVATARGQGAALSFLSPDFLIADEAFRRVVAAMRDGYRGVSALTVTARAEAYAERAARTVRWSPSDLAAFAAEHPHPLIGWLTWNAADFTEWPYVVYWELGDGARLGRGFMRHPVYVYPTAWRDDFTGTIDWDFVALAVGDVARVDCPPSSDDLMIVEISDSRKREPAPGGAPADPFSVAHWARKNMIREAWPLFSQPTTFAGTAGRQIENTRAARRSETFAAAVFTLLDTWTPAPARSPD